jgi:hypothetical protein
MKKNYLLFVLFIFFINSLFSMDTATESGTEATSNAAAKPKVTKVKLSCTPDGYTDDCLGAFCDKVDVVSILSGGQQSYCKHVLQLIGIKTNNRGQITMVDLCRFEAGLIARNEAILQHLLANVDKAAETIKETDALISALQREKEQLKRQCAVLTELAEVGATQEAEQELQEGDATTSARKALPHEDTAEIVALRAQLAIAQRELRLSRRVEFEYQRQALMKAPINQPGNLLVGMYAFGRINTVHGPWITQIASPKPKSIGLEID